MFALVAKVLPQLVALGFINGLFVAWHSFKNPAPLQMLAAQRITQAAAHRLVKFAVQLGQIIAAKQLRALAVQPGQVGILEAFQTLTAQHAQVRQLFALSAQQFADGAGQFLHFRRYFNPRRQLFLQNIRKQGALLRRHLHPGLRHFRSRHPRHIQLRAVITHHFGKFLRCGIRQFQLGQHRLH